MKRMQIYEPAMCCSTGLCGISVDPELLRISTVLNTLKSNGIIVERFNLNNAPMKFVQNKVVNTYLNLKGPDGLPVTIIDGKIAIEGRYPTNDEITKLLGLPQGLLDKEQKSANTKSSIKHSGYKGGYC